MNEQKIESSSQSNIQQLLQQSANLVRDAVHLYLETSIDYDARSMGTETLNDFLAVGSRLTPAILMTTLTVLQSWDIIGSEFVDDIMRPFLIQADIILK